MKILLIYTGIKNCNIEHYSKAIEKYRGIYPPLGILYVAQSCINSGHEVNFINLETVNKDTVFLQKTLQSFKPEIIGFYVFTWTYQLICSIAKLIKKHNPSIKIILGGPQINSFPEESLDNDNFDFAIQGEGEKVIVEFLNTLSNKQNDFSSIKGLIYKKDGKIIKNTPSDFIKNLDDFSAGWDLINFNDYHDIFTREKKFTTLIAGRGCPYDCVYCDRNNRNGKVWRTRAPANVADEMKMLNSKYGIKEFMFYDDNFIIDKTWVREFCKLLIKNNRKLIWEVRTRIDLVDKEILLLMKEAGCYRIRYGFESGNNDVLKKIKKNITVEQSLKTAEITRETGIEIFGYFMLGFPWETRVNLDETINLALKINPHLAVFSKVILIPNTELFNIASENDNIKKDYWIRFIRGQENNPAPFFSTAELPEKTVDAYIKKAYLKFYIRTGFIINYFKMLKNIYQLKKHASFALKNFTSI